MCEFYTIKLNVLEITVGTNLIVIQFSTSAVDI